MINNSDYFISRGLRLVVLKGLFIRNVTITVSVKVTVNV